MLQYRAPQKMFLDDFVGANQRQCICDRISENGSKSHIFISLYLLLLHEQYYIFYIISYLYMEFNAQIIKTVK